MDTILTQKDICTSTFIAALFTITKIQPKCPLMDEKIKKMGIMGIMGIHNGNYDCVWILVHKNE